jgi:hypothetical protein
VCFVKAWTLIRNMLHAVSCCVNARVIRAGSVVGNGCKRQGVPAKRVSNVEPMVLKSTVSIIRSPKTARSLPPLSLQGPLMYVKSRIKR